MGIKELERSGEEGARQGRRARHPAATPQTRLSTPAPARRSGSRGGGWGWKRCRGEGRASEAASKRRLRAGECGGERRGRKFADGNILPAQAKVVGVMWQSFSAGAGAAVSPSTSYFAHQMRRKKPGFHLPNDSLLLDTGTKLALQQLPKRVSG